MNISDYAKNILYSSELGEKLLSTEHITSLEPLDYSPLPEGPGRAQEIQFSDKKIKFPRFHRDQYNKELVARALHFFANHELLAMEMIAGAILAFPIGEKDRKKCLSHLVSTLADEQRHFMLYRKRLRQLGYDFGDFPLNDFFWKYFKSNKNISEFFCLLSLTFESANLDFSYYYFKLFENYKDYETSQIMKTVYLDEIQHVAKGRHWLTSWHGPYLWQYFTEHLPTGITPARAKGTIFLRAAREKAGLESSFIDALESYQGDFAITRRKHWKTSGNDLQVKL